MAIAHTKLPFYIELICRAAAAPIGIALRTNDARRAGVVLDQARREASKTNPALARVQIRTNPSDPHGSIFLIKGNPQHENGKLVPYVESKKNKKPTSVEDLFI